MVTRFLIYFTYNVVGRTIELDTKMKRGQNLHLPTSQPRAYILQYYRYNNMDGLSMIDVLTVIIIEQY